MKSNTQNSLSRRDILKGSIYGLIGVSFPGIAYSNASNDSMAKSKKPYPSYPSLEPELVSEVVGKSHFDLERVKEMVEKRPELARASWEWRFGDFESAIGAASHVGRRDIVEYLLSKGASPNIFTYTVLGAYDIVKQMIDLSPGIQKTLGPHGISLLDHAYAGLRLKDSLSASQKDKCKKLIDYLEELGDANGPKYEEIGKEEKMKYLGEYRYGEAKDDGFVIKLNMRDQPALGTIGGFGGAIYKISENHFTYNGAPSVKISFQWENDNVKSVTVKMPGSEITAIKT